MKRIRKRAAPIVRWTPSLKRLRALSIRRPWAWLIVSGYEGIENRSWATKHRGPRSSTRGRASQVCAKTLPVSRSTAASGFPRASLS